MAKQKKKSSDLWSDDAKEQTEQYEQHLADWENAIKKSTPDPYSIAPVALPPFKQAQDRLIHMETRLLDRLKALADRLDTDNISAEGVVLSPPYVSLADFNKDLPSRLTALEESLFEQINRIETLLFS